MMGAGFIGEVATHPVEEGVITIGADVGAEDAGGVMDADDAAASVHHEFQIVQFLLCFAHAMGWERVAGEDDGVCGLTQCFAGPFGNDGGFDVLHVVGMFEAMSHQPGAGDDFVRAGRMVCGADDDEDVSRVCSECDC